jgi:ABC-type dipeptide/oligopeptide/nickel transport system permease component
MIVFLLVKERFMVPYIMKRILLGAFTLLVISFISFFIVQLPPGDIVDQYIDCCLMLELTRIL